MHLNKNKSILLIDFRNNLIHCVSSRRTIHIIHVRIAPLQLLILAISPLCLLHHLLQRRSFLFIFNFFFFFFLDIYKIFAYRCFRIFFFLKNKSHKKWVTTHSSSPTSSDFGLASPGVVEMLKAEVNTLRTKILEMEKECKVFL
jgi:hypothetical protein